MLSIKTWILAQPLHRGKRVTKEDKENFAIAYSQYAWGAQIHKVDIGADNFRQRLAEAVRSYHLDDDISSRPWHLNLYIVAKLLSNWIMKNDEFYKMCKDYVEYVTSNEDDLDVRHKKWVQKGIAIKEYAFRTFEDFIPEIKRYTVNALLHTCINWPEFP